MSLHITRGPQEVKRLKREVSAIVCKRCKRRTVHREVLLMDTEPSYYEPHLALQCKRCDTIRAYLKRA